MRRVGIVLFGLTAILATACKTGGTTQLKEEGMADGEPDPAPAPESFCVGPRSIQDLKEQSFGFDQWAATFKEGRASPDLIPGKDRPGVMLPGQGFPKIVFPNLANQAANLIWGGKTVVTDEQGNTRLINRFLQAGEGASINLFTAKVVMENTSNLSVSDGKPVILLDYRQSEINAAAPQGTPFVPVIKAVRDEIRLVCETIENGERHRLYLGPTFLLPQEFASIDLAGRAIAKVYEHKPILWFALEFTEPAN